MGKLGNSAKQGSGRNNFLSIKEAEKKRVRVLLSGPIKSIDGSITTGTKGEPFSSWWHRIKEDAAKGREYHEWLCVGKYRGCRLCLENDTFVAQKGGEIKNNEKPHPLRKKTYVNVWSYEDGKVLILAAGSDLFDKLSTIEDTRKLNADELDVTIVRSGKGIRTSYDAVAGEVSPFVLPDGNFLYNLDDETAVSDRSVEDLEKVMSGEFDKQFTAARESAPSMAVDIMAAMNTVVNFGQYAGKTIAQIMAIDVRYVQWLVQNAPDPVTGQAAAITLQANQAGASAPPPPPPPLAQPPPPLAQPSPTLVSSSPPVSGGAGTYQAPPIVPPAPVAQSPFDMLQVAAKTVEQLRAECITKASSDPKYRDPSVLKAKMLEAGGSLDLNSFTAKQLEKLIAIL